MKLLFLRPKTFGFLFVFLLLATLVVMACSDIDDGQPLDPSTKVNVQIDDSVVGGQSNERSVDPTNPEETEPPNAPDINANWNLDYTCKNGKPVSVTIGLDITGGIPPYTTDPALPVERTPGETVSIKITSNTTTGEPSKFTSYYIPTKYKCDDNPNGVEHISSQTSYTAKPVDTVKPQDTEKPPDTQKPPDTAKPPDPTNTPKPKPTECPTNASGKPKCSGN